MRIVKQNQFKNLGELHKEWTEAGVKTSRATTHRRVKEFGYSCRQRRLTWAKEKKNWTVAQWSKVLFSDESKFCISFGNQGPRVWRKGGEAYCPSSLKSSVKFPHWLFGMQCHHLVSVHCVFWKPTSLHQFTKKFCSTSCFLLLTSILKMLISFSSRIWSQFLLNYWNKWTFQRHSNLLRCACTSHTSQNPINNRCIDPSPHSTFFLFW